MAASSSSGVIEGDRLWHSWGECAPSEKPSKWKRGMIKLSSKCRPKSLARQWSSDGLSRRHPDEIKSLDRRAVKRFSSSDVKSLSPNQVRAFKPKHIRQFSSGRAAEIVPDLYLDSIETILEKEKFQNFDDLYRIGLKLTSMQRYDLFGEFCEEIFETDEVFSKASLKCIPMIKERLLRLMVVMSSVNTTKRKKVGELLIAMNDKQRKHVIKFVQTEELAYAIHFLPLDAAKELYVSLSKRWRVNIDAFLPEDRQKKLLPHWEEYWRIHDETEL